MTADELLKAATAVRPLSPAATQLMATCTGENVDTREITQIIECDPGLAARVLQLANSTSYGLAGRVRTIDHAVIALGFRGISDMALAVAAAELFSEDGPTATVRQQIWHHSLACAVIARQLACVTRDINPGEAFLAGIFHDVGKLLLLETVTAEYTTLINDSDNGSVLEAESAQFGITHQEIGQHCAMKWGLRTEIVNAIRFHHVPEDAPANQSLVELTSMANGLAKIWQLGDGSEHANTGGDEFPATTLSYDTKTLDQMYESFALEYQEALTLCSA